MKDVREVEPGVWSVLDGTRSYEVRIAGSDVRVNGRALRVEVKDPREWNPRKARETSSGSAQVRAPMPGKVVALRVAVDDSVELGQGVIVVEAMKMQNELKSPRAGRVASIAVKQHDTVNAGAVLLTIE